jgi:hypothetical protein
MPLGTSAAIRPRKLLASARGLLPWAATALLFAAAAPAASAAGLEATFGRHVAGSAARIDHAPWDGLLKAYVKPSADGINRVAYARFKAAGHAPLKAYLAALQAADPTTLDRNEQFAYWANLYNAKTIDIVLDKYPVKSIKDISLGGGLLAAVTGGPWKAKVVKVKGEELSLDDIEHGILRAIFKDPRVHYSVNCASIGCPNLPGEAFTGARLEAQLDAGARAYVNHPRGLTAAGGRVKASSIYNWFQADFGGSAQGVLDHARKYAEPALKRQLDGITAIAEFDYDWRLNDAKD